MFWLECLLDSLIVSGVGISDNALLPETRNNWLEVLKKHQFQNLFKLSQIGRQSTLQHETLIRNDDISWLEETRPCDMKILSELDLWRAYLNQTLRLSTRTTEAHFAQYKPGHYYKRHKDQHESHNSRVLTFVVYLHSEWHAGDGGKLLITDGDSDRIKQIIEPLPGRVVIFRSDEVWHEVQKSSKLRSSLTGWFRYDSGFTKI